MADRSAVACSKYDKGSTWGGFGVAGLAVAAGATAVSQARAARRRRGKMLVGHVRYSWLSQIEAHDRRGLGGKNKLQLVLADPEGGGTLVFEAILGRHDQASVAALDVARRAAASRATTAATSEERAALEVYARQPVPKPSSDQSVQYRIPA